MPARGLHELDLDGARVVWRESGDGHPVVLVHGSPISSWSFRHLLASPIPGFRWIAPDLPGFGRSDKPPEGLGFEGLSAVLARFLERVAGPSYTLLGQDWGGPVAFAAADPDRVRQLVLVNTTVRPDFRPPRYWWPFVAPYLGELLVVSGGVFGRGLPLLLGAARDPAVAAEYRECLLPKGARHTMLRLERQDGWETVTGSSAALLGRRPRTLILWGDPDPYFRSDELAWLRRELPWAELCRLPGGGHFPQEDAPEAFARGLRGFLERGRALL